MRRMIPGIVSNCWRWQLENGESLDSLIAEAVRRDFGAVELRQTCLGRFESADDHLPDAEALTELPSQFPGVRFNVAVPVPFLNPETSTDAPLFVAGRMSAQAVAGEFSPHLRLVDLNTTSEQLRQSGAIAAGATMARLCRSLIEIDGILSVENSIQAWTPLREAVASARDQLGTDADRLRLCFDPCNLLFAQDGTDPVAVTSSLSGDELSMVHFKQRRNGLTYPAISEGEVDWVELVAVMNERRFTVPGLFEVEPHQRIWEYLAGSWEYLRRLGLDI